MFRLSIFRSTAASGLCALFILSLTPVTISAEIGNNLKFEMERGSATYEKPRLEFRPGDWVKAYTRKFDYKALSGLKGKDVTFTYVFESGGKNLATHSFQRKFEQTSSYFKFNILPNPDSGEAVSFRWDWSGGLARALAALPGGKHEIIVRGYVEADGNKTMVVRGEMVYDNRSGNGSLAAVADQIEKKRGFDIQKQNEKLQPKHQDFPVAVTLYNGCLDRVVVRYRTKGNREASVTLNGRQSKQVTALALESLIVHHRGKVGSGPTVSRRSAGKTLRVCR